MALEGEPPSLTSLPLFLVRTSWDRWGIALGPVQIQQEIGTGISSRSSLARRGGCAATKTGALCIFLQNLHESPEPQNSLRWHLGMKLCLSSPQASTCHVSRKCRQYYCRWYYWCPVMLKGLADILFWCNNLHLKSWTSCECKNEKSGHDTCAVPSLQDGCEDQTSNPCISSLKVSNYTVCFCYLPNLLHFYRTTFKCYISWMHIFGLLFCLSMTSVIRHRILSQDQSGLHPPRRGLPPWKTDLGVGCSPLKMSSLLLETPVMF